MNNITQSRKQTKIERKRSRLMKQLHEEGWIEIKCTRYSYFQKEGSEFRIEVHAKTIKVLRACINGCPCLLHFGRSSKIRFCEIRNGILVDQEKQKSIEL